MMSAQQRKILRFPVSEYDALICDGAVRSGKTSIMSMAFVAWAMHDFNQRNFGICGKSVQSAVRNIIRPLVGMTYWAKNGFVMDYSVSTHMLTVTKGKAVNYFYLFGGKDERSQDLIQGITLAGVLLDEVALMPESFVNQATARCSVEGSKLWFNCNPENPQHWFYQNWILKAKEKNAMYLHFVMKDNPSLTKETLARYENMYSGVFYRRFILGEWVQAEGLVYPMFSKERNVVKDVPPSGRYFISIDYGILNPFSAGLWCLRNGVAYRVAEYYYDGRKEKYQRTDEEHYAAVKKLAGDHYIQRVVVDPSASSFIEVVYRHKEFPVDKAINDVIPGIAYTATMLQQGKIRVHESCKDCIREFGLYCWDETKPEDAVAKEFDHAMDDTRYFAYTVLRNEVR
jgi:PBSX family phage terminase large subunit